MKNLLQIAMGEIGVKEVSGPDANPQILKYARDCQINDYTSDEVAWCSLFINWVALKSGLERTKNLTARSWLNAGIPVINAEPGDIVVFWRESRESWKGHVGVFLGCSTDGTRIYCLGGNQGNQVSITAYTADQVLGYRRLRSVKETKFSKKTLKRGDTGKEVRALQDALKQLGFNSGTSDGIFGPKTERTLKDFQATSGSISINGIFDASTREFLVEVLKAKI
ncbi:TIGR02594 family protein [Zunongwangia sp. F260]|uniref:TIGR02594 family protein n=1 Tax=Autumnicola lenta TaxID=3075593 RepID=A0ABU3CNI9_9FLAO|nr:TIGR02594 family protein [Zunongwangia sp. F260]MDT0647927.1 TIGR02594 family protein [Zunongwangia sp. F260]